MTRYKRYGYLLKTTGILILACHLVYASHFLGWAFLDSFLEHVDHAAGWLGVFLMLLCLLYLPRKKKYFTWGKVKSWYTFHVGTGLAGSLLILFHAYGDFHGIAGVSLVATWLVMLTGVIGHFIYRRLPDEVGIRARRRQELLKRLEQVGGMIEVQAQEVERLRQTMATTGTLSEYPSEGPIRLPRPTLVKNLGYVKELWATFRKRTRETRELSRIIKAQTSAEMHAIQLREKESLELLEMDNDTKNFLILNEIYSLWRKVHVPISWFMWWCAGLHVFAWIYY